MSTQKINEQEWYLDLLVIPTKTPNQNLNSEDLMAMNNFGINIGELMLRNPMITNKTPDKGKEYSS